MKRIKNFFIDFKKFISRGNILDLAVAMVVGSAFTAIVTSLVNDIIMPFICAIFGSATVEELYFLVNGAEIYYGKFIQAIINFLLVALVLFIVLRLVMNASNAFKRTITEYPTKEEKKQLKELGIKTKNKKELINATKELREKNKPAPVPPKPTQEELLTQNLEELKKKNYTRDLVENAIIGDDNITSNNINNNNLNENNDK